MAAADENTMTFGSEFVFIEMAIDVQTRDPDQQQTLVCVMDGEQKLWDLQREWLGRSVEILDLFHALERVREVSKVVRPKDKSRREAWVSDQLRDLLTGNVETVIRRWRRLARTAEQGKRWTKDNRETVTSAIGYFSNRHRMQYDEYLSKGYPIGSGIAEGACRNLVKDRMDRTGMHWRLWFSGGSRQQPRQQRHDFTLQLSQGIFGLGTVQVVDMPVFNSVHPIRKLLRQHPAVFGFLQGDDQVRPAQVLFCDLYRKPNVAVQVNPALL